MQILDLIAISIQSQSTLTGRCDILIALDMSQPVSFIRGLRIGTGAIRISHLPAWVNQNYMTINSIFMSVSATIKNGTRRVPATIKTYVFLRWTTFLNPTSRPTDKSATNGG